MKQRTPPVKAAANGKMFAAAAEEKSSVMGQRKKGKGTRSWLMIDPSGRAQHVEAGKHAIMRRACLPARDLRILDPLLSYPSTILGRERAIVVNLEHIKAIITAQEVLLLNSKDPAVVPIVLDMQRRLPMHLNSLGQQVPGDGGGGFLSDHEGEANHHSRTSRVSSRTDLQSLNQGTDSQSLNQGNVDVNASVPSSSLQMRANEFRAAASSLGRANAGPSVLPFEFRALEVCLEAACSCLDAEATMLEREAYPALDELTSKLSTLNLERVRQIKSRLVAISGRVQKVRDEIEQLLDDDGDMAEMYLTDKLLLGVQMEEGTISPASSHGNLHHDFDGQGEADDERLVRPGGEENQFEAGKEIFGGTDDFTGGGARRFESHRSTSSSSTSTAKTQKLDVEELEMLLEAYFVQIEGTLNKLSALREYVDDTEDYINIMLDDKQNHLLQMGVLLTTATLVVSAFIVVAGIFGMNIEIDLFNENGYKTKEFVWVVCGSVIGCCVMYVGAVAFCKYKRLID